MSSQVVTQFPASLCVSCCLMYLPISQPQKQGWFPSLPKDVDKEGDKKTGLPPKDLPFAISQIQMSSKISQNLISTQIPPHTEYFSCLPLPGKVKEEKAEERSEAPKSGYFSWARARSALEKNKLHKNVCCVVQGHQNYRGQCHSAGTLAPRENCFQLFPVCIILFYLQDNEVLFPSHFV